MRKGSYITKIGYGEVVVDCSRARWWRWWIGLLLLLLPRLAFSASFSAPPGAIPSDFTFNYSIKGYRPDLRFTEPAAMALDERHGLVYVADTKAGTVNAFSAQGIAKFQYGAKQNLNAPIGVAVNSHGDVYVTDDAGGPIVIIDEKGDTSTLALPDDDAQRPAKPGQLTIDRDDNLYVVERAHSRIYMFDKQRKLKLSFGRLGKKPGDFQMLQAVAVDRQGRIYALDTSTTPVQVFDRNGKYLYGFGYRGERDRDLSLPASIFLDRQEQVWIVDQAQHRVKVFDRSGQFLRSFGSYGQDEGSFFHPIMAVVDSLGHVYVLEIGARRMQVFTLRRPYEPFSVPDFSW